MGDVVEDYVEKTTVEDQYPVLTSSQRKGIVLQDDFFAGDRVNQNGNIGYFIIPRGYFAFRSRSDNDVFVFNRNDAVDMGIISYFYPVFKPRGVDSDFLLRRLNYGLEDQIKINSEGTGQHVLSLKKFKNMIGLFPSYEEQKKIGSYFSQIDHLITLHQQKYFYHMLQLINEIAQDENKYKGQSILNIVENMKLDCINKVISDFCVTWYASKDDVMYAALHYRNGEIPNESVIKATIDYQSYKDVHEKALPKFRYYTQCMAELRKTLDEEIKPLLTIAG